MPRFRFRPHPPPPRRVARFLCVMQACWLENRLFLMDKNVFSAEYLNWVCDLTALVPPPKLSYFPLSPVGTTAGVNGGDTCGGDDDDVDTVEISAAKVALYLALDTVARAKDKERLSQLTRYLRSWFQASPAVCRWALEQASRERACAAAAHGLSVALTRGWISFLGEWPSRLKADALLVCNSAYRW